LVASRCARLTCGNMNTGRCGHDMAWWIQVSMGNDYTTSGNDACPPVG